MVAPPAAAPLLLTAPAHAGEVLQGTARVVDGDTLYVAGVKVRLWGVDAPEKAQACLDAAGAEYPCGAASAAELQQRLRGAQVRCSVVTKDQYQRSVAACDVLAPGGGVDIGAWMVANGQAVAYRQYTKNYIPLEEAAKQAHKGMWQGAFTPPAEWRRQQRSLPGPALAATSGRSATQTGGVLAAAAGLASAAGVAPAGVVLGALQPGLVACGDGSPALIKGNISARGEKIYHTPASGSYARVQIDASKGERFFCSEQEALDQGFRRALR